MLLTSKWSSSICDKGCCCCWAPAAGVWGIVCCSPGGISSVKCCGSPFTPSTSLLPIICKAAMLQLLRSPCNESSFSCSTSQSALPCTGSKTTRLMCGAMLECLDISISVYQGHIDLRHNAAQTATLPTNRLREVQGTGR